MSDSPPHNLCIIPESLNIKEYDKDNNNANNKFSGRQHARNFIIWYKHMVDNERYKLGLYLSDDVTLEWFGKTIKTRKKVSSFLKYDMECTRHDFTTIENIEKIQTRYDEMIQSKEENSLATSITMLCGKSDKKPRKRLLRSNGSPEWAEGCQPLEENSDRKRLKTSHDGSTSHSFNNEGMKQLVDDIDLVISSKGDGIISREKRKCVPVTPPHIELGQGDCLPSTSGADSEKSHDILNTQLPKLAVRCNGFVEFARTKNNRDIDSMKWERKCKLQISYSQDPLNIGEYVIWAMRYTDESKCRRNLLAAFQEAAKDDN